MSRLAGRATPEGTARYQARIEAAADYFTPHKELLFSSLGAGSFVPEPYKEESYRIGFEEAVAAAVRAGANVLDTAAVYRYGESEKEIGRAIRRLVEEGSIARDELIVATKAGLVPLCYPFPENPYRYLQHRIVEQGLALPEEIVADQYCIEPAYLRASLEESLERLGLQSVDIFYLHNPEFLFGYLPRAELLEKIRAAFELFEAMADEGKLSYYGIASWNALLVEPTHEEALSLEELEGLARAAGGEHHRFAFIQMPYSLGKTLALSSATQPLGEKRTSAVVAARKLGLGIIGSSPLARMNLFKRPFSPAVSEKLGVSGSDLDLALQFARSLPGMLTTLVGSSDAAHTARNLDLRRLPKSPWASYKELFQL